MKTESKYEIIGNMETVEATTDTWEDAIYAAQKYAPSLIYATGSGKCRFVETSESVPA